MATLVVQQTPLRQSRSTSPISSSLTLDTTQFHSPPIPNKHIPYCSPGPVPSTLGRTPATPPASPPTKHVSIQNFSCLYPADTFPKVVDSPPVYSLDAAGLAQALNNAASQPLPDPKLVFPWLHGLHPENQVQLTFFNSRRKALRKTPKNIRGITIVKAGGDLTKSRLKGAIAVIELMSLTGVRDPVFYDVDPKDGFSVRNFHIQVAKIAMVSDIVVYGDESTSTEGLHSLAKRISRAQITYREKCDTGGSENPVYSTFVISSESSIRPR